MKPGGWGQTMSDQMSVKDHTFGYLSNNDGSKKAGASQKKTAGKKLDLRSKAKLVYVVKPGDTLWSIAKQCKTTVASIAAKNGMKPTDTLKPGRKLYV